MASNESTEKYEITEKEARVKDISNPLTLNLDEKYVPLGLIHIGHPDCEVTPGDWYKEEYIHYIK